METTVLFVATLFALLVSLMLVQGTLRLLFHLMLPQRAVVVSRPFPTGKARRAA